MTMHLAQGLNTIRNRKYTPKMTKQNIAKWNAGMIVKNRQLKRIGDSKMTFEQYVNFCHGIQPKKDIRADRSHYKVEKSVTQQRIEEFNEKYPSTPMTPGGDHNCGKKEVLKYTGTLVKGIATMHKSNAVPVINQQHAIDIARMRR